MKEFIIRENDADTRLDKFVAKAVPSLPTNLIQKYIRLKRIKVNSSRAKPDTRLCIGDKIEIQMELETMVSGQKSEQNIMLVMPVVFIVVLKSMGGGLIDLESPVGILSVTAAIIIFVLAYFVSKKIMDIKL